MTISPRPPAFPPAGPIPTSNGKPVKLILPPSEERPHRYIELPNGLQAILVSDTKADHAAACLSVGVGHMSDPDDLPGTAHFCEHLMFLGTKTFPKENEYKRFLSAHNGSHNASTSTDTTRYHFDVEPSALEGALDRFAGFFTEPLFAPDCVESSVNTIESEFRLKFETQDRRYIYMLKHLSTPGHPFTKFGVGNLDTLWHGPRAQGRNPRDELLAWVDKYYCARRMSLAVLGREDLDTLEKMVTDRFSAVPVRSGGLPPTGLNGVRLTFDKPLFSPEGHGIVTFTKPIGERRQLVLAFPFPDVSELANTGLWSYITFQLRYKGRGSVLSYLKDKQWATSLSASGSNQPGCDMMLVECDLTEDGLRHWEDVILVLFKHIQQVRALPPSEETFNELKHMRGVDFRFAPECKPHAYVQQLSRRLRNPVPRDAVVSFGQLWSEFDPQLISDGLSLLDPRNARVIVYCNDIPKNVTGAFDRKEPIYGTDYHQQPLRQEILEQAVSGPYEIPGVHVPGPNQYIPTRLDVDKFEVESPRKRPQLLRDTEISRLWFKKDDRFWQPKTNVQLRLWSPVFEASPRSEVLTRLLIAAFTDAIQEETYEASLGGIYGQLYNSHGVPSIDVGGFSDKLVVLLRRILEHLVTFEADPTRFVNVRDKVRRHWVNVFLKAPIHYVSMWQRHATSPISWTYDELLKEIEHISAEEVSAFGREAFSRLWIQTLVHGNQSAGEVLALQDMVEQVLSPRPLAALEKPLLRTLLLPEESQFVWELPVRSEREVNNCISYKVHVGLVADVAQRNRLALLRQVLKEPVFNQLRTIEQLGYVVRTSTIGNSVTTGLKIELQSERDPIYLENRIEAYLTSFKDTLENMPVEEFERHRNAVLNALSVEPKNLHEESMLFAKRIFNGRYEFGRREADGAEVAKATKEEVLDLFLKHVYPGSKERRKLSIHLRSQLCPAHKVVDGVVDEPTEVNGSVETVSAAEGQGQAESKAAMKKRHKAEDAAARLAPGNVHITDIDLFKASLRMSAAVKPVEPLVVEAMEEEAEGEVNGELARASIL